LDEADANLDESARRALDANIKAFPGTVLMVSHRHSALRHCDTVWVLFEGRLEQQSDLPSQTNVVPLEVTRAVFSTDRQDRLRGPLCG
jgi:ABC-type bacteriocin/lantibiotic exporter with double-glycine peptidase domain